VGEELQRSPLYWMNRLTKVDDEDVARWPCNSSQSEMAEIIRIMLITVLSSSGKVICSRRDGRDAPPDTWNLEMV